ncbi:WD40 repeat domain-containing serine/threonine protein kinase [Nonomuraea sp. NPDC050556]|uniref:WD40 repeat domain-containing serine/threonine protein kinase n=1 Tax=Nonomuraea sp. NPDC050556 TaxID=3364369 RepID=UPI0037A91EA4
MDQLSGDDPQRVGGYWLAGRLGAGGQGVVYDAYDGEGARVAVKVLHASGAARPAREVAAAQRVASFCTARVLAADLGAARPYIVSEYVPGPSLRAAVEGGRRFTGDDLHRLATAVATALTAVHEAGVVHRDLKPDNVLLGPDGPRVIDFGIARTLDMSLTAPGELSGTPAYMAPEVFTGQRAGAPADVFAWGAIMVFAATGAEPFRADDLGAVMHRVLSIHPDLDDLPASLRPLVSSALEKDPEVRPTARELLLALVSGNGAGTAELLSRGSRAAEGIHVGANADPELSTLAEDAYAALAPQDRELVAEVFLRLIAIAPDGEETGRRTARAELVGGRGEEEVAAIDRILRAFAYVVAERDGHVTLSRPALLRAWPRLRVWVDADRDGLTVLNQINTAARHWTDHGRRDADLLQGTRLEAALGWAATGRRNITLTPRERDFLQAGTRLTRRRTTRRRLTTVALACLLVAALAAGGLAVRQSSEVERQSALVTGQRNAALARAAAREADLLRAADPTRAMLLSVAAWRLHDSAETRSSLMNAAHQRESTILETSGSFSADGTTLAEVDQEGVRLIDVATGRRTATWTKPAFATLEIRDYALSRTGRFLAVSSEFDIAVYDARNGTEIRRVELRAVYLGVRLAFTAHEPTLSIVTGETAYLWDSSKGGGVGAGWPSVTDVAVSPKGDLAAVATKDGKVSILRLPGRERVFPKACDEDGKEVPAFTPDGATLVCAGWEIKSYDTATGRPRPAGAWQGPAPTGARISGDGALLLAFHNRDVRVWNLAERREVLSYRADTEVSDVRAASARGPLRVMAGQVLTLAMPPGVERVAEGAVEAALTGDARWVVLRDRKDGVPIRLRDLRTRAPGPKLEVTGEFAAVDPTGRMVVTRSANLEAWDVATGRRLWARPVEGNLDWRGVTFSPDGRLIGTGLVALGDGASGYVSEDRTMILDAASGRVLRSMLDPVGGGAFTPDSRQYVNNGGLVVDVGGGEESELGTDSVGADLVISPTGVVAADAGEGRVGLWSLAGRRLLKPLLRGARDEVRFLAFTGDGSLLASVGEGGTLQIWDVAAGSRVGGAIGIRGGGVESVAYDAARRAFVLVTEEGWLHEVTVDPERMATDVCARAARSLTAAEWAQHLPGVPYRATC